MKIGPIFVDSYEKLR